MSRPHILFFSSWYPVRGNPTHGIFNRYFAEAVSKYCRVSVLHIAAEPGLKKAQESTQTAEENIFTVTVYYRKFTLRIPLLSQFVKYHRAKKAARLGYGIISEKQGKPELMQLNVIMPMAPIAMHISKQAELPLVISENWSGYTREDGSYRGFFTRHFTRRAVAHAARIMPTSAYLKDAMQRHRLNGNYTVVPNTVNTNIFILRQRDRDNTVRFIHISSLNDREKNVSGILRAFKNVCERRADLQLLIVGAGVDEPRYREMVIRWKLNDRIQFTGNLPREEVARHISASDALVMFSNYETFCLVIPEAFACGKPVITSAAGAIPSYFRDFTGIMVAPGDEDGLASAMLLFAKEKENFDADKIRSYAVDHFSNEKVGAMLHAVYREVLSK